MNDHYPSAYLCLWPHPLPPCPAPCRTYWVNQVTGVWVYPVLERIGSVARVLFFAAMTALMCLLYTLGETLNSYIWDPPKGGTHTHTHTGAQTVLVPSLLHPFNFCPISQQRSKVSDLARPQSDG